MSDERREPEIEDEDRLCANPKCGHSLADHENMDEIIGGQCFECPCGQFVFAALPEGQPHG